MTTIDPIVQAMQGFVSSVGFPIAVCWFLLSKGSQVVGGITSAINDMKTAIQGMQTAIEGLTTRLENIERERMGAMPAPVTVNVQHPANDNQNTNPHA